MLLMLNHNIVSIRTQVVNDMYHCVRLTSTNNDRSQSNMIRWASCRLKTWLWLAPVPFFL